MWVWLKITQEGLRRFWSMFALTRVAFWYRFFEPQPCGFCGGQVSPQVFEGIALLSP